MNIHNNVPVSLLTVIYGIELHVVNHGAKGKF
jgi:hypothetical protein